MLETCAPGHTRTETTHYWRVAFGTKVYPTLPLGKHGSRRDSEIQVGHVKKMVRLLEILECAKRQIEQLR